ncbi:MAG: hypothetical protein ACSHXI_20710 [Hoeflea sp.]|uniref:hypothetical protein n=1 Tax=Hoeflea sp. TaxID=1940281 RepID=UPI003EF906E2
MICLKHRPTFPKNNLLHVRCTITLRSDGNAHKVALSEAVIRRLFQVAEPKRIQQRLQQHLDQAVQDGADPVWVIPHKDNFVIDENQGWYLQGPVDVNGLKPVQLPLAQNRGAHQSTPETNSTLDKTLGPGH